MRAVIRALIAMLTLGICLVVAVPGATARTLPARPAGGATAVAVTAPASLPAWPVIGQGSVGQPVRSLQYLLNARGAGIAVDGIFGPRTNAAVRTFQGAHGLAVDGIVGPLTWRSVIITVRHGSVGSAVKAVQDQANFRGGRGEEPPVLSVDGIFGAKTRSWVMGFQGVAAQDFPGVAVDGIVGPVTWQLLISGYLSG
jgi:peptidoglycan hydrolase-like protein with peptidoglycan-binding domain